MDIPFLKDPKKVLKSQDFNTLTEVASHIYVQDFSLEESFCRNLIEKFENDPRKAKGHSGKGYDDETKDTWDLHLTSFDCYRTEDKTLHHALTKSIKDFKKFLEYENEVKFFDCPCSSFANDTGYQLQKYIPGGGYIWHQDGDGGLTMKRNQATGARSLVFMWYLSDVEWGGQTGFKHQNALVEPKIGRLVLFPASWTHLHCAYPVVAGTKYIITGWVFEET